MMTTSAALQAPVVINDAKSHSQHAILFNLDSCQIHGVAEDVVTIGNSSRCNITLPDGSLSGQHCMIVRKSDGYNLYDLNSDAGCSVNGVKVQENCRIYDGDEVTLGNTSFVFNLVDRKEPQSEAKSARVSWVKAFGDYLRGMGRH